jgi:hypothetical protein
LFWKFKNSIKKRKLFHNISSIWLFLLFQKIINIYINILADRGQMTQQRFQKIMLERSRQRLERERERGAGDRGMRREDEAGEDAPVFYYT